MSTEIDDIKMSNDENDVKETKSPGLSFSEAPDSNVVKDTKSPRLSFSDAPGSNVKETKSPRTSFSKSPDSSIVKETKSPRTSFSKTQDSSPHLPPKSPSSKVNFQRPQPGQPLHLAHKPSMQRQVSQALKRASRLMPNLHRVEAWMYAAVFVALYTLIMLFRMSTFGFICIMVYTVLITMLVLRFFGHGPLVDHHGLRR